MASQQEKTGRVIVKFSKTDAEFQDILVRQSGLEVEFFHPQLNKWLECPQEWIEKIDWK